MNWKYEVKRENTRKKKKIRKVLRYKIYVKDFIKNKKDTNREYRFLDNIFYNRIMITKNKNNLYIIEKNRKKN